MCICIFILRIMGNVCNIVLLQIPLKISQYTIHIKINCNIFILVHMYIYTFSISHFSLYVSLYDF